MKIITTERRQPAAWKSMRWTFVTAICVGIFMAPGAGLDWMYDAYDNFKPVVTAEGKLLEINNLQGTTTAVIKIVGEKKRNCQYLAIRAYALRDNLLFDINMERVDRKALGITKPLGNLDFGVWAVWPIEGTKAVRIFLHHSCDGRLVVTKAAEVQLVK
jgi:hypothetical protein